MKRLRAMFLGGVLAAALSLPFYASAQKDSSSAASPDIPVPTVTIRIPGPTVTLPVATITVPGQTITAAPTGLPLPTVTKTVYVPGKTKTVYINKPSATKTVSVPIATKTVTATPRPEVKTKTDTETKTYKVIKTILLSTAIGIAFAILAFIGMVMWYTFGRRDQKRSETKYLRGLLDTLRRGRK
jgi:hypothetical protein